MSLNIGTADCAARVALGIALLVLAILKVWQPVLLGVVGVVLISTAAVRICPLYMLFGLNTCSVKSGK